MVAGMSTSRPGCSGPHWTWPWTPLGLVYPQLLWELCLPHLCLHPWKVTRSHSGFGFFFFFNIYWKVPIRSLLSLLSSRLNNPSFLGLSVYLHWRGVSAFWSSSWPFSVPTPAGPCPFEAKGPKAECKLQRCLTRAEQRGRITFLMISLVHTLSDTH